MTMPIRVRTIPEYSLILLIRPFATVQFMCRTESFSPRNVYHRHKYTLKNDILAFQKGRKMKLLIVAATKAEIETSIPLLEQKQIDYLITGVGMTATAYALGKKLQQNQYDLIVNVGIAGTFDYSIPLGTTVQIHSDIFSELGAQDEERFIPIEEMGFGVAKYISKSYPDLKLDLPSYVGITVNTVHGESKSIEYVKSLFPTASIESMEGAAVLYSAQQEDIACIQIRSISNRVEKRDKSKWNIPLALKNLNNWLKEFIETHHQ